MIEVTKDEFFRLVGVGNIHPTAEKFESVWRDQRTRVIVGVTTPGYLSVGEKSFRVTEELYNRGRIGDAE